jgi:hypothetical protein
MELEHVIVIAQHSRSLIPHPIDARKAKQAFQPTKPEDRNIPSSPRPFLYYSTSS